MAVRRWLIPLVWAVGGGVGGYLTISCSGIGASPVFRTVGEPYDRQKDIFALHADRARLVGGISAVVGILAGLLLVRLRRRPLGMVVGGITGAIVGFGAYWDLDQSDPSGMALFFALTFAIGGMFVGFASVREPSSG
jgi:hypothetical protein